MEHATQVDPSRFKRFLIGPTIVLAALFTIVLGAIDIHLLIWVVQAMLTAPFVVLSLSALLLLPGLALLRLFGDTPLDGAERWPLAIGLSCALPPLLLLFSEPLGLRWNIWLCWGYLGVSAIVVVYPTSGNSLGSRWRRIRSLRPNIPHTLLWIMTGWALVAQLYTTRDLPTGMWGDSYHHTIIAQLIIDNGGLFSSWQPYAPLVTFTYHYGFHSLVAWFAWLSNIPVTQGLLIVGQTQCALAVPLVYIFTRRLVHNESAALWAALLTGFVSFVPNNYVNWGRYTQLAGQTIMPATLIIWMALLDGAIQQPTRRDQLVKLLALATIATAGLSLTHYRAAVFAACFVVVYALYLSLQHERISAAALRIGAIGLSVGALTALLIAPWLIRLHTGALLRIAQYFATRNIGAEQSNVMPVFDMFSIFYPGPVMLGLALLGLILLVWQRHRAGAIVGGWVVLLVLVTNPFLIGLPGAGIITNTAVSMGSYVFLAPLAGTAIAFSSHYLTRSLPPRFGAYGLATLGFLTLLWGMGQNQQLLKAEYQLFTPADAQAMDWIRRETPPDAKFFVNSFPAYSNSLYAGSDGGWWLPFMTNRPSNLPPITYGSEAAEHPMYGLAIKTENATLMQNPIDSPETTAALQAAGYTYLYDGPTANPPGEFINPAILAQSSWYEQVYNQDGVTIWRIR